MSETSQDHQYQRHLIFMFTSAFIFLIIISRFLYVQILGGEAHSLQSESNRTREVEVVPSRGRIYDRNGKLLVDNIPAYSVFVIPYELKNDELLLSIIRELFPHEEVNIKTKLQNASTRYQPVKILTVDHSKLTYFVENRSDLPGVISQDEPQRYYPSGIRAPHFLGYIKEINKEEIRGLEGDYYNSGDVIGKMGLEKQYEHLLRGQKGFKYLEVDVLGREVREIQTPNTVEPVPGNNLILTLDRDLQYKSEELLGDSLGAIIALNPFNGEIYAAVSKPDYEPFFMSSHFTQEEYNILLNDLGSPLYNRVTQSMYPPGSTYKLVGAIAALNDNIISPEQTFVCNGSFRIGRKVHYCWRKGSHGKLNLFQAIEQSCNVYFYNVSQKLTLAQWAHYGKLLQFGENTGLDFPEENPGILPVKEYMDEKYKDVGWIEKGQMINLIIGQGDLLVTPLQMVKFTAAIATKGKMIQPHFLKMSVNSETDSTLFVLSDKTSYMDTIRDEVWEVIRQGMHGVVNGEKGTARTVRQRNVLVAGKTGTAQNIHGQDHAWFIGYAPEVDPVIALAVFVENGGGGGRIAAPIAREIFKEFFRLQNLQQESLLSSKMNGR